MKTFIRIKQQNMYPWYLSTGLSCKLNILHVTRGADWMEGPRDTPGPSPRAPTAPVVLGGTPKPERKAGNNSPAGLGTSTTTPILPETARNGGDLEPSL